MLKILLQLQQNLKIYIDATAYCNEPVSNIYTIANKLMYIKYKPQ